MCLCSGDPGRWTLHQLVLTTAKERHGGGYSMRKLRKRQFTHLSTLRNKTDNVSLTYYSRTGTILAKVGVPTEAHITRQTKPLEEYFFHSCLSAQRIRHRLPLQDKLVTVLLSNTAVRAVAEPTGWEMPSGDPWNETFEAIRRPTRAIR